MIQITNTSAFHVVLSSPTQHLKFQPTRTVKLLSLYPLVFILLRVSCTQLHEEPAGLAYKLYYMLSFALFSSPPRRNSPIPNVFRKIISSASETYDYFFLFVYCSGASNKIDNFELYATVLRHIHITMCSFSQANVTLKFNNAYIMHLFIQVLNN